MSSFPTFLIFVGLTTSALGLILQIKETSSIFKDEPTPITVISTEITFLNDTEMVLRKKYSDGLSFNETYRAQIEEAVEGPAIVRPRRAVIKLVGNGREGYGL